MDKFSDAPKLGGAATLLGARSALSTRSAAPFFGTQIFNTSGATREQDEPNHAEVLGGASHWLTYQAPETGILRLTTEGSEFDTVMAIYSGSGTEFASLKVEASDNNSGPDGQDSVATVKVRKNSIYFIAIDGVKGATGWLAEFRIGGGPCDFTQPEARSLKLGESVGFFVEVSNPIAGTTAAPRRSAISGIRTGANSRRDESFAGAVECPVG